MAVKSADGNSLFFATGVDNSGLRGGIDEAYEKYIYVLFCSRDNTSELLF